LLTRNSNGEKFSTHNRDNLYHHATMKYLRWYNFYSKFIYSFAQYCRSKWKIIWIIRSFYIPISKG